MPFHDLGRRPLITPLPSGDQRNIHLGVTFAARFTHALTILDARPS
jgi:hypothetical protein